MNRRYSDKWSASIGGAYTMLHDFLAGRSSTRRTTCRCRAIARRWSFKATGSYDAPWGIRLSPVFRHQSGANYARTLTITAPAAPAGVDLPGLAPPSYADATDDNREDNIWVFDVRAEKQLTFGRAFVCA